MYTMQMQLIKINILYNKQQQYKSTYGQKLLHTFHNHQWPLLDSTAVQLCNPHFLTRIYLPSLHFTSLHFTYFTSLHSTPLHSTPLHSTPLNFLMISTTPSLRLIYHLPNPFPKFTRFTGESPYSICRQFVPEMCGPIYKTTFSYIPIYRAGIITFLFNYWSPQFLLNRRTHGWSEQSSLRLVFVRFNQINVVFRWDIWCKNDLTEDAIKWFPLDIQEI
jgi:hypothetical protein